MKIGIRNTVYVLARYSGMAWMLLFLFYTREGLAQDGNHASFISTYNALTTSINEADDPAVDVSVKRLLSMNKEQAGLYDSLVISLLIWHYNLKSEKMPTEERISFLNAYREILLKMKHSFPEDLARFYALYIPVFRFHYQTDSVGHYLDRIDMQLDQIRKPSKVRIGWFYEKGRHVFSQGDYEAALTFSMRGLEYLNQYFPDQLRMKYLLMNAIGIGYRRLGKTEDAIAWYENILQQNRAELNTVRMTGAILNNLGLAYKDCGDWDNAIREMSNAITYYAKTFSSTYEDIGSGYDNIAICYQSKGDLVNALRFSEKSMDFIRANLGPSHPDLLLPMNSITSTYLQDNNLNKALKMNRQAMALLSQLGWKENDPRGDYYLADGFDVFAYAVDIHRALYEVSSDTSLLRAAITAGVYFMEMTDYAYDHLKNDLSKELFQSKHARVFSACIRDIYTLYEKTHDRSLIETAFAYSEKFKALELLYAAQKDKANHVDRYRLLNEDYQTLTDSIRFYEGLLFAKEENEDGNNDVIYALNRKKEAMYQWKERIKKEHPDYYQLIYHPEAVSIEVLQKALDHKDQCILSYHLADDAVYMIVIAADTLHFVKKALHDDIPGLISLFRNTLYGYFSETSQSEALYVALAGDFVKSGSALYNFLLAPVNNVLRKRVIIIVDKSLGYIPFDLLLTRMPDVPYHFRDHHYVLFDHAISYSYSARLWMDMRTQSLPSGYAMLAIAPFFPDPETNLKDNGLRDGLGPLHFNTMEVQNIGKIFPGKMITGRQASKSNFIQNCGHYKLIHLATHSKANDDQGDYSFLAFTDTGDGDSKLMAGEIYNLDLQADLVTLSACETGLGELKSGEGIISLARAFTYAGARSIVSSLWSVNDKSTPSVMTAFYRYLKEGHSKDIAMQKAKLEFLTSRGHADAHPFFWGSFICVGDTSPVIIDTQPLSPILFSLLGVAGILVLIFFIKKGRKLGTSPG